MGPEAGVNSQKPEENIWTESIILFQLNVMI